MNKNKPVVVPLFSKPLYENVLNIDTKKIVPMLKDYKFRLAGGKGPLRDAANISSISINLHVLDDKKFKFLKDKIMKEFYLYASDVMKYTNEFEITTSWFTMSTKGQSSNPHSHNNCMISGVLYLQTNENSGNISFNDFNNKRYDLLIEEHNLFNSTEWRIPPVDGLLLFFPSEVHHKFQENKSDDTRYSLAFNLVPTGLIGNPTNDSHVKIKVEK